MWSSFVEQAAPVESNGSGDLISKVSELQFRVRTWLGDSAPQKIGINTIIKQLKFIDSKEVQSYRAVHVTFCLKSSKKAETYPYR